MGRVTDPSENADREQAKKRRFPWTIAATATVTVVSGLLGGWAGSALTVKASVDAERRVRVGEVYADYLNAADSYYTAAADLDRAFDKLTPTKDGSASNPSVLQLPVDAFEEARHDYQGAINDVYVYGSEAAWEANRKVAKVLPVALGSVAKRDVPRPDPVAFGEAYADFLDVFCREATAEPRQDCESPDVTK